MLNRFTIILLILTSLIIATQAAGCGVAKDSRLQMTIRETLSNDRNIQVDKLTINVRDGVVTISGELYTQDEIDRVIEVVSAIPGVVRVLDQMSLPDNYNTTNPTFLDPF